MIIIGLLLSTFLIMGIYIGKSQQKYAKLEKKYNKFLTDNIENIDRCIEVEEK